jgi:hypothetical protein
MKKILYITLSSLLIAILFACEKEINPDLDKAEAIIVVDAWLNQKMERQEIKITRSQPYFDNTTPAKISGAIVSIEDLDSGTMYEFQEGENAYYWQPVDVPFGVVGHHYKLTVNVDGEIFEAFSTLGRVPPIDDVQFNFEPADLLVKQDYYKAEFIATDPAGVGDAYWIKTWKNGEYLGKPGEINIAFDAGFTASQSVDGEVFNLIIRQDFLNPTDKIPDTQNEYYPSYLVGDSVYVEVHAITPETFDFLWAVYFQTNRTGSITELFATPLANVPTNIQSTDENSITNIAGFFNVGGVSGKGKKLTQEMADEAKLKGN